MVTVKIVFTTLILMTSVMLTSNVISADYINDAKKYYEQGEYKAAIIQLKNQLKKNPNDAEARYLLGNLYLKQYQNKAASKELDKAVKLQPDNIAYKLAYSQSLLANREFESAKSILNFNTKGRNESIRQVYLGNANLGLNQLEKAKHHFEFAVNNNNYEGYTGLAKIAILERNMILAEKNIKQILSKSPENNEAMRLHAAILNLNKNYQQALDIYNQLIEKKVASQGDYLRRGSTFLALEELEKAHSDIQVILSKNKNQA